jgi:hypothetical protein
MAQKEINYDIWHNPDDIAMIFHWDIILKDATLLATPDGDLLLVYPDDKRILLPKCNSELFERISSLDEVLCQRVSRNPWIAPEALCIPVLIANDAESRYKNLLPVVLNAPVLVSKDLLRNYQFNAYPVGWQSSFWVSPFTAVKHAVKHFVRGFLGVGSQPKD